MLICERNILSAEHNMEHSYSLSLHLYMAEDRGPLGKIMPNITGAMFFFLPEIDARVVAHFKLFARQFIFYLYILFIV